MKYLFYSFFTLLLFACNSGKQDSVSSSMNKNKIDSLRSPDSTTVVNETSSDYTTYYVVVADTSSNYFALLKKMTSLSSLFNLKIDSMGRYFDQKKNLICLPENDEDELYAGTYFPRRYPSHNLSLEYLNYYKPGTNEKTIALITGIYETKQESDEALIKLKTNANSAFNLVTEMYIGCMH